MKTIDTKVSHAIRPVAAIVIAAALALAFGAMAAPTADTDGAGGGIFSRVGAYLAEVGEALGSE